jgi:thiol-disulfide isomerase/thioredoxin
MRLRICFVSIVCMALAATVSARDLAVGDAAPGLDIEEWLRGEETGFKKGQSYIVSFWATHCIPCRKSIARLSELQEEYAPKGLTVIGISYEEPDIVRMFVKTQGDRMGFTVAVDRRQSTKRAWVDAVGKDDVPVAFIIDGEGRVAYFGDPSPTADGPEFEAILAKVVRGRYDPKLEVVAAPMLKGARNARKRSTWRIALKQYDNVIELNPTVFADVAMERFEMLLVDMADAEQAYEYARKSMLDGHYSGDVEALRVLAETIATDPQIPRDKRDLDLALETAKAAMKAEGGTDPQSYATLALIHFHRGETADAIRHQKRAWMIAKPKAKPELRRVLKSYQAAADRTASR